MIPRVRLRELRPGEYGVLDTVFAGLSPGSRNRRFHVGLPRLNPQVRERLADVDGRSHIAVAAFDGSTPIGIARLIALGDGRAEVAVEVVDAWQRRGVGLRLVLAVAAGGRRAGFREVEAEVLAENMAAQMLFATVFPDMTIAGDGPEITITAPLAGVRSSRSARRGPHRHDGARAAARTPGPPPARTPAVAPHRHRGARTAAGTAVPAPVRRCHPTTPVRPPARTATVEPTPPPGRWSDRHTRDQPPGPVRGGDRHGTVLGDRG